jgi:hypothetical protein
MYENKINEKYIEIMTNIIYKQNEQLLKSIAIREHLNYKTLENIFLKSMKTQTSVHINDLYHQS